MNIRWLGVGLVLGVVYAAVTPPGQVPDEMGHFWHAQAVARGHFAPARRHEADFFPLPVGMKTFFWVLHTEEGAKRTLRQLQMSASVPDEPTNLRLTATYPSHYTPVAYVPQTLAALIARAAGMRPLFAFYLGRMVNLLATLALIGAAMRVAPRHANVFLAVALLPMALFEMASWSADAPTLGLGLLFTAMMLEPPPATARWVGTIAAVALLLSLCKPAYFLIALLALFRPMPRRNAVATLAATAIGIPIAAAYASYAWFNVRIGMPIEPGQQIRCMLAAPLRFSHTFAHDVATNGVRYIAEMIGRLGLLDVDLPSLVTAIEIGLLIAVGLTAAPSISGWRRIAGMAIVLASAAGIILSQYLTWSIVCGDTIEGVQGRYFLPLLPLALAALALPSPRWRVGPKSMTAVAVVCNGVAIVVLLRHYWQ